jgi:hypothetical protein
MQRDISERPVCGSWKSKQSCDHSVATLGKQDAVMKTNEKNIFITGLNMYTQVLCDIQLYLVVSCLTFKYSPDYLVKIIRFIIFVMFYVR